MSGKLLPVLVALRIRRVKQPVRRVACGKDDLAIFAQLNFQLSIMCVCVNICVSFSLAHATKLFTFLSLSFSFSFSFSFFLFAFVFHSLLWQ